MKAFFAAYALLSLLLFTILAVLSYGSGAGYVYVNWHGWQLQSNLFLAFVLLVLLNFILQLLWYGLKQILQRVQRQRVVLDDLTVMHPYEQLGVIWLLDTATQQQSFIQSIFDQSAWLQTVVQAKLAMMRGEIDAALALLAQTPPSAFELAELLHIEILLHQQQTQQAFDRLEFLQQHALSPWLLPLQSGYQARVAQLWAALALQNPWLYLRSQQCGHLLDDAKEQWLQQLLQQFEQADYSDLLALQERYLNSQQELLNRPYLTQLLWLKLLARMPDMSQTHEQLALRLLAEQFNQDVFYLWFQQKLLAQNPDYADIQHQIDTLAQQYSGLPILTFAQWHIFEATGRTEQATQLLELYPDNVLMNYLRIKNVFKHDDRLIQQLNAVFATDANFLQFKI